MNKITTLDEYNNLINSPGIHIIKVSASWCNPCKTLGENIDRLKDSIKKLFTEIDVDEAEDSLIAKLNIRNVPVLIFCKNGGEYRRLVGLKTLEEISSIIELENKDDQN